MNIKFHDVDGTLIDTTAAVRDCQVKGLMKLSDGALDYMGASALLGLRGLKASVESYGIDVNTFYSDESKLYSTFDPYDSIKNGTIGLFDDVKNYLNKSKDIDVAISSSSQRATERKLDATNIAHFFTGIYAEFGENVKPSTYMAEQAIKHLDDLGFYSVDAELIGIGDKPIDIQFYNNVKEIHPNTTSLWINRDGKEYDTRRSDLSLGSVDYDGMIASYNEL